MRLVTYKRFRCADDVITFLGAHKIVIYKRARLPRQKLHPATQQWLPMIGNQNLQFLLMHSPEMKEICNYQPFACSSGS